MRSLIDKQRKLQRTATITPPPLTVGFRAISVFAEPMLQIGVEEFI